MNSGGVWIANAGFAKKEKDYSWNSKCIDTPRKIDRSKSPWRYNNKLLSVGTIIEIERFKKPIFVSHGTSDKVWSVDRSKNIEKRLRDNKQKIEAHYFEYQGHGLDIEAENKRRGLLLNFLEKNL